MSDRDRDLTGIRIYAFKECAQKLEDKKIQMKTENMPQMLRRRGFEEAIEVVKKLLQKEEQALTDAALAE